MTSGNEKVTAQDFVAEHDFRMQAIEEQRNRALRDHAIAVGSYRLTAEKLETARARIAELEKKIAELEKPKEA